MRDNYHVAHCFAVEISLAGERFPSQGRYIDVDGVILGEVWQTLLNDLGQEDRAIEASRVTLSHDARVAFDKGLHTLKVALQHHGPDPLRDLFDRQSFEADFALVWED